jgi:hypothetical protein
VWVSGCTNWHQIEIADVRDYSTIRVTSTDGDELRFRDPELASDTLRGRVGEDARIGGYRWSDSVTAIHVEHIARVEAQKSNTTGYAVVGVVGFAVLMLVLLASQMEFKMQPAHSTTSHSRAFFGPFW